MDQVCLTLSSGAPVQLKQRLHAVRVSVSASSSAAAAPAPFALSVLAGRQRLLHALQVLWLVLLLATPFAQSALAQPSQLDPTATQVGAGFYHTCAVTTGGGVKCWGRNGFGQLGDGGTADRWTPGDVSTLTSDVSAIATGPEHSCALTTAGGVKCWGKNGFGQIGDGGFVTRLTPVNVTGLTSGVAAIATGLFHTCALTTAGGVKCWGYNGEGALGDGTRALQLTPVDVTGLGSGVTAITAGAYHTCALTTGGGVKCWGLNASGQLGDASVLTQLTPVVVSGLTSGMTAISAGYDHTCALTLGGGAQCWGLNGFGQLGDGSTTNQLTPAAVTGVMGSIMVAIAAGPKHTCALTTVGGLKCWGYNGYGQLGNGTNTDHLTPADVSGLSSGVASITTGNDDTCALTIGGGVKCWGLNVFGQLGDDSATNRSTAVDVIGLASGVAVVAAGTLHTCALTSVGGAKCWGYNSEGQLGDGTFTTRPTPVDVTGLTRRLSAIATGATHSCALTSGGGVKCWGKNFSGQLGDGSTTRRLTPVDVFGLASAVSAIATGSEHTCALTTVGGVQCWGNNVSGQLGDGLTVNRSIQGGVTGLPSNVVAIAAGEAHTCALTTTGGVKCWGNNVYGQLGDTSVSNRLTPVDVLGLTSGIIAITAGASHTCALSTAGSVQCWGYNGFGAVGDGSTSNRSTPVAVSSLTSAMAAIAAGGSHTCARTAAGAVKCWGYNYAGQLGDGSVINRLTPVDVTGLASGATALALGDSHTCARTTLGGLQCWGNNTYGRLGDASVLNRLTPVDVLRTQSISFTAPIGLSVGATAVTLNASASSGLAVSFDTWTPGICTVTGNTVTATATALCGIRASQTGNGNNAAAPQKLVLVNVIPSYSVTATANPAAGGSVICTSSLVPSGGDSTCTATANTGYTFTAFSGDCIGATCVLTNITSAKSVTATFTLNTYTITAIANPVVGGTVTCTANPVPYAGSSTCTVAVNPPYVFESWSGDCTGATCTITNVTGPRSATANLTATLNVDGSNATTRYHPLVDGLIILRFMQAVRGPALTAGTSAASATISDPTAIATYLSSLGLRLDIDGNNAIDPATDGLLILRYMLGLRGQALINNALGGLPRARSTAVDIEAWLAALMP